MVGKSSITEEGYVYACKFIYYTSEPSMAYKGYTKKTLFYLSY